MAPKVGLEPTFASITLLDVRSAGGYLGIISMQAITVTHIACFLTFHPELDTSGQFEYSAILI